MKNATRIIIMGILTGLLSTIYGLAAPKKRPAKPVSEDAIKRIVESTPEKPTVNPKQPRRILVFSLCQGFYHQVIPVANKALEILGRKSGAYDAVVSDDMEMFTAENLAQFDAVLFNNTTRLTFKNPEHRNALMAFVKSGKGVIGIHAASDNFSNWPEAAAMMGGLFDGHPWGSRGTWAIKLDEPTHPLNRAFEGKGFKIKDEIYQIKGPYSRDTHRVLVSLDLTDKTTADRPGQKRDDKDFAITWIRRFGKGRVFYCSFGHNNEVFWNPAILQHYLDGIQYALGDLEMDDTPSNKVSK